MEVGVEDNFFADTGEIRERTGSDSNEITNARYVQNDGFVATIGEDSA